MSETFYKGVRMIGSRVFFHASEPRILHAERAANPGGYLLAANHSSPYDVGLVTAATPRVIYWLSIAELFRNPWSRWFLRSFGAEPLDRSKTDTRTVRAVVRHLRAGRVVGIFPEGRLRAPGDSLLEGGPVHDGVFKIARLARVPVLPCVVVGSGRFADWRSWLPGARTRWAVAFGEPIDPPVGSDDATRPMVDEMVSAMRALHAEIADYA